MLASSSGEQSSWFLLLIPTLGSWRAARLPERPLLSRGIACERRGAVAVAMAPALAGRALASVVPTRALLTGLEDRTRVRLGEARDSESLGELGGSSLPMSLAAD